MENETQVSSSNQDTAQLARDVPKGKQQSLQVAITAMMTALVTVSTFVFRIHISATGGYFNFGEVFIFITAILFGSYIGGFAGGVGSALADIILGYYSFSPITLVVKGLEGFIVGYLYQKFKKDTNKKNNLISKLISIPIGGAVMILGYFIAEIPLFGIGAAAIELPWNLLQVVTGLTVTILLTPVLEEQLKLEKLRL